MIIEKACTGRRRHFPAVMLEAKYRERRLLILMDVSPHPGRYEAEPTDHVMIGIVGANAFNNDLLADYLQEQIGIDCFSMHDYAPQAISESSPPRTHLFFFDCDNMLWSSIEPWIASTTRLDDKKVMVVCFNVDPNIQIEQYALRLGVRGVIYKSAPTEIYTKAIQAVVRGEMWYPRKVLQRFLEAPDPPRETTEAMALCMLTRREQTILNMIARGRSNKQIAGRLCISPHTVKTHIYNLFKKIKVTNRFQATLWLTRHH